MPTSEGALERYLDVCARAESQGHASRAVREFESEARADIWLCAEAPASGLTVVTYETSSNSPNRVKIPDACAGVGARCMGGFDLMRARDSGSSRRGGRRRVSGAAPAARVGRARGRACRRARRPRRLSATAGTVTRRSGLEPGATGRPATCRGWAAPYAGEFFGGARVVGATSSRPRPPAAA